MVATYLGVRAELVSYLPAGGQALSWAGELWAVGFGAQSSSQSKSVLTDLLGFILVVFDCS